MTITTVVVFALLWVTTFTVYPLRDCTHKHPSTLTQPPSCPSPSQPLHKPFPTLGGSSVCLPHYLLFLLTRSLPCSLTLCVTSVLLLLNAFPHSSHLYFFTGGGLNWFNRRLVVNPIPGITDVCGIDSSGLRSGGARFEHAGVLVTP